MTVLGGSRNPERIVIPAGFFTKECELVRILHKECKLVGILHERTLPSPA